MALTGQSHVSESNVVLRAASTQNFRLSERHYGSCFGTPMHAHVKNYIIVTLDGNYQSTFDTRTERYASGTVTFHMAGVSHVSHYSAEGAHVLYVELPAERLGSVSPMVSSHLNHFSLHSGPVEWTARQLYNEFNAGDRFSSLLIDGYVMQLLAQLLRRREVVPRSLPVWLGKADEIIRSHFTEPLGLSDIAKQVSVHPGHLSREYVRHYRSTIGEQIRRLRVDFACQQLTSTDLSLADIACSAGFADQSHFTVSFKQQMGTTPLNYRKTVKGTLHFKKM